MTQVLLDMPNLDAPLGDRVAFGAAELDRIQPNWFRKVDLITLDMSSGQTCIIGQAIYGCCFGCKAYAQNWNQDDSVKRGFLLGEDDDLDVYDELQNLWVAAITARRVAAKESEL